VCARAISNNYAKYRHAGDSDMVSERWLESAILFSLLSS